MLIVMDRAATPEDIESVLGRVRSLGLTPHPIPGAQRTAIGVTGNSGSVEVPDIEEMPGVLEVIRVSHPYKLVSREYRPERTIVDVGGVPVGGQKLAVVAGPCAVESLDQARSVAEKVKKEGAHIFRGGAYKPRTSPYSFQGLGEKGLEILARIREEFDLPVMTEVIDTETLPLVEQYSDCLQIGARNMQNFSLLRRAGISKKPVLLKRGMSATVEELLLSAEYILAGGNGGVILCERGVRTFADHTRNTLDLSAVVAMQRLSHLPVMVDPSHGTGKRHKVIPLARAAVAVGADSLMIEVHHQPEAALSDGPQAILPAQFADLMEQLRRLAPVVGRTI
jgi:3-deoxy-7-phosphoheptulonate synthase